ncbi:hypothetical protein Aduo_000844 [Ancylostoma duodenale]
MEDELYHVMAFKPAFFENKFIHWSELPPHLKLQVLRNLPYPTLRNFMFLSKKCWTLSSMFKTEAACIFLDEMAFLSKFQGTRCKEKSMDLFVFYIPPGLKGIPNSHRKYQLSFVEDKDGGCSVRRIGESREWKRYSKGVRYSNETYFYASLRVFFQLTKFIEAKDLLIEMSTVNPEVESILRELPASTSLSYESITIRTEDKALLPLFLPFINPGCKLSVYSFPFHETGDIFMDTAFFDSEMVRAAPSFRTESLTGVTDEQLLLLQGSRLFMKTPYISSKGINGILRQWSEGRRRIERITLSETQILNHNDVVDGIDPSPILVGDMRRYWDFRSRGFRTGIRNRAGDLIVVDVATNCCDISPVFLNE